MLCVLGGLTLLRREQSRSSVETAASNSSWEVTPWKTETNKGWEEEEDPGCGAGLDSAVAGPTCWRVTPRPEGGIGCQLPKGTTTEAGGGEVRKGGPGIEWTSRSSAIAPKSWVADSSSNGERGREG